MGEFLFVITLVIAMSIIVEWITKLATDKDLGFISYIVIVYAIYFIWKVIATGGIIR